MAAIALRESNAPLPPASFSPYISSLGPSGEVYMVRPQDLICLCIKRAAVLPWSIDAWR